MTPMYKVLVNHRSAHGGTLAWSLPTAEDDGFLPGDWHTINGEVIVCHNGLHLTADPTQWLKNGCEVYLAEGRGDAQSQDNKTAYAEARLLRPAPEMIPDWWKQHERFVADIPRIPWCQPDGCPKPEWRLFVAPTLAAAWAAARAAARDAAGDAAWGAARAAAWDAARAAARDAARDAAGDAARDAAGGAARDAAGDAAWGAARDAALYTQVQHICDGLSIDQRHRDHVEARWEVWRKGYCLYGDVNGVLYVYAKDV